MELWFTSGMKPPRNMHTRPARIIGFLRKCAVSTLISSDTANAPIMADCMTYWTAIVEASGNAAAMSESMTDAMVSACAMAMVVRMANLSTPLP